MDIELIQNLSRIHSPSGEEYRMKAFLLQYVESQKKNWRTQPQIIDEPKFGDGFLLVFGNPRTVIFSHMDTIGFMVRYGNQLIPIGGPQVKEGYELIGQDSLGPINCKLQVDQHHNLFHDFPRAVDRGTSLVFRQEIQIGEDAIVGPYLDNRLGIYNALKVAETLDHGVLAFSCFEEIGGGNVPALLDTIMERHPVQQALISDITWVTEGVEAGAGVAISIRDQNIPRRSFINRVIESASQSGVKYQLEVESSGSSDGAQIRHSRHGLDWCFIGAPEENVHSPEETVRISDLESMISLYKHLMHEL